MIRGVFEVGFADADNQSVHLRELIKNERDKGLQPADDHRVIDVSEVCNLRIPPDQLARQEDKVAHRINLQAVFATAGELPLQAGKELQAPCFLRRIRLKKSGLDRVPVHRQFRGLEKRIDLAAIAHLRQFSRVVVARLVAGFARVVVNHVEDMSLRD